MYRQDVYKAVDAAAFTMFAFAGYKMVTDFLVDVIDEVIRKSDEEQTKDPDELPV